MLPRQENLSKIQKYLRDIEVDVEVNNYWSFYDINIISENFCKDLLNITFDLKLENVNFFKNNEKAIDLADKENGIAIQVTSEKTMKKIKHTFNEYIDEGLDKVYPQLYIVTLVRYNPSINNYIYKGKNFSIKDNVLDYRDYIRMLSNKYDNSKYMQILNFLDSEFKSVSSLNIDKYIEKLEFETNRDLRDAIVGNRLYPYNVKSCPELPAINKIEEKLEEQKYCIISGEAGCGKSITAYQVGYRYFLKGWNVYRYLNNKILEYEILKSLSVKTLIIIDDAQIIDNFQIDRVISNVNDNLKIVITVTDSLKFNDETTTYISNKDSVKKLAEEYLKRKKEIYPIVEKLDNWIKDSFGSETLERRIERASKAPTPWLFNFVLRGGWNKAREDFKRISERNEADKLLVILAILQIIYLDKAISKIELMKKCEVWEKDNEWFENNMKYLIDSQIIIEEYGKYRCAHIRYAIIFLNSFINNSDKEDLDILVCYLRDILEDTRYPLQGIYWLLDSIDSWDKGDYIRKNLIEEDKLKDIVEKYFNVTSKKDIRDSLFILDTLERYNKDILKRINEEKYIKKIAKWIEKVDENTGYALGRIINDFFINEKLNIKLLKENINIQELIKNINSCNYKAIWHISEMLDRLLYAFKDKKIGNDIISKIDIDILSTKINQYYKEMYLEEFLNILAIINLYNEKLGIRLYNKTKECINFYFNKDALKAYESMDDKFIWGFLGYSFFREKQPKIKYRKIAKEILDGIDIEVLARQVSDTNLHDMERYARLFFWIDNINANITKAVVRKINFDKIDNNSKEYFKKPPRELRLFISSIGSTEEKVFYEWMDKHLEEIQIADPVISLVYPKVVENCMNNNLKVDIFGHNDCFEEALHMLKAVNEYDSILARKVVEISKDNIISRISNLKYIIDFTDGDLSEFMLYIVKNYEDIFKEIIEQLDFQKVKQNLQECYENIKKDTKDVRNKKTKEEFEKILKIFKRNKKLVDLCDEFIGALSKI